MSFLEKVSIAIRPKTLAASFSPVIIAYGLYLENSNSADLKVLLLINILLAATLIQIISNLANDLYDFKKGADNSERLGPKRLLASNLASESQVKLALLILVGVTLLSGLPLVIEGGLPILLIGIASIIFAFLYTAGPYPLAYLGLGELFVFIFFGPLALSGTYFLLSNEWTGKGLLISIIPGLFSAAVLLSNNIRDIEGDRLANKRTLSVKMGQSFSLHLHKILLFLPSLILISYAITFNQYAVLTLLFYLVPAQRIINLQNSETSKGQKWNKTLAKIGSLNLIFSLAFLLVCIIKINKP